MDRSGKPATGQQTCSGILSNSHAVLHGVMHDERELAIIRAALVHYLRVMKHQHETAKSGGAPLADIATRLGGVVSEIHQLAEVYRSAGASK